MSEETYPQDNNQTNYTDQQPQETNEQVQSTNPFNPFTAQQAVQPPATDTYLQEENRTY